MSDKSTVLRGFNHTFFEFVDDIIRIFPDNTDIKTTRTAFDFFKKANPTTIIKVWYHFISIPYKDIIMTGDISFFFEKDYQADLAYMSNSAEIMAGIDRVRGPIKTMDESNKKTTTVYIQNLCKLSDVYNTLTATG